MATGLRADAVEVNLTAGERSGTRWANSSITVNLVQWRFYNVIDLIGAVTRQFPVVQRSLVLAPKNARVVLTLYGRV
mgnify:CR=1 FL=1